MAVERMKLRLDKYLADMGLGTRSQIKKDISKGQVLVNGTVSKDAGTRIDTEKDQVSYLGQAVTYAEYEYYMLNKPAGVVSATEDRHDRTVLDLIDTKQRKDLFPVGRLDKDTEGLLLITNDGALAHRLLSPKSHVDKVYFARIEGKVTAEDVLLFQKGVDIGEQALTLPARLEILSSDTVSEIRLTICEGKFHQVKRMFESVGKKVLYLKRLSMGTLILDDLLPPGAYRTLTAGEIRSLQTISKKKQEIKNEWWIFTCQQKRNERTWMGSGRFCLYFRRCLCRPSLLWSCHHHKAAGIPWLQSGNHCTAGLEVT